MSLKLIQSPASSKLLRFETNNSWKKTNIETKMVGSSQRNMGFNKLERAEKVKDNKLLAVMMTVLVTLLLISQLSLASGSVNSKYIPDINYDALEIDEPENNDVDIYTPDFLHAIQDQELYIALQRSDYDLSIVYVEHYIHSGSIRSPPFIS